MADYFFDQPRIKFSRWVTLWVAQAAYSGSSRKNNSALSLLNGKGLPSHSQLSDQPLVRVTVEDLNPENSIEFSMTPLELLKLGFRCIWAAIWPTYSVTSKESQ